MLILYLDLNVNSCYFLLEKKFTRNYLFCHTYYKYCRAIKHYSNYHCRSYFLCVKYTSFCIAFL